MEHVRVLWVLLAMTLIGTACSQITEMGNTCAGYPPPVTALNKTQYSGKWFETYRLNESNDNYTKVTFEFTMKNGSAFTAHNMGYKNNKMFHKDGVFSNSTDGNFTITYGNETYPHTVLSTDYDTYSYVVGCTFDTKTNKSHHYGWILSRKPTLNLVSVVTASKQLNSTKNLEHFILTPPTYCSGSSKYIATFTLVAIGSFLAKWLS